MSRVQIYSIINATPDSFYGGSRVSGEREILSAAERALSEGCDVLDIGGFSTRPGHSDVPLEEEYARLYYALRVIREEFPLAKISIDTFRSEVVRRLYDNFGDLIVNDIEGAKSDPDMLPLVASLGLTYILMASEPTIEATSAFFATQISKAKDYGLEDILLDPGFGFGKTIEQNYEILRRMETLTHFGLPLFVGLSRKSMIWRSLSIEPEGALNGTTALNFAALERGASILRVHDTREAVECVRLFELLGGLTNTPAI